MNQLIALLTTAVLIVGSADQAAADDQLPKHDHELVLSLPPANDAKLLDPVTVTPDSFYLDLSRNIVKDLPCLGPCKPKVELPPSKLELVLTTILKGFLPTEAPQPDRLETFNHEIKVGNSGNSFADTWR